MLPQSQAPDNASTCQRRQQPGRHSAIPEDPPLVPDRWWLLVLRPLVLRPVAPRPPARSLRQSIISTRLALTESPCAFNLCILQLCRPRLCKRSTAGNTQRREGFAELGVGGLLLLRVGYLCATAWRRGHVVGVRLWAVLIVATRRSGGGGGGGVSGGGS
mmetsp:Transcript_53211/g.157379  ORF Transcript_53211/g.157379 Transcript_53211/m.157379 type:complete len:160 (-) Transcript_53211:157-636(-)